MMVDLQLSVLLRPSEGLGYIAGFAITDQLVFAAGGTSSRSPTVLASSNARDFAVRATPRQLGLRDVLAVGDVVWACGEYGQLATSLDHGATWKLLDTGTDACLFALALASDGAVWVVGDHGYAARVVADRLERVELGTPARLAAVYAVKDDVVVLGFDGTLYRWRRGEVARIATGATKPLTSLAISRLGTWVVVGDGGFIARSPDGAWWTRVASGVELDLEASCACHDGKLVVVGDRGLILVSADDGRRWQEVPSELALHLWAVERFGGGVLIGGDGGLIAKLAPPGDQTWHDRADVFGRGQPLDAAFSAGADGFIAKGLATYLAAIGGEQPARDRAAPARRVTREEFADIYGVAMPSELAALLAAIEGRDRWSTFAELRLDSRVVADAGGGNLFELRVCGDQEALLGTGLVEAFCGAFAIGSQRSGDTYFMELYEWDGPRQILHFDHQAHAFTGVFANSLDSLVYLAALARAHELRQISDEAYAAGLRELHGKAAPWPSLASDDPELAPLDAKRRDTEFFFYRSRWICALLDGRSDLSAIPSLFNADFNQVVPQEQLTARCEACEKLIPTALYSMWRAFLFDEPELEPYLDVGRRHRSRLVRDAATLLDELRAGRNELGRIHDMRAHLAAFRALELDPRHAEQRELASGRRAESGAGRVHDVAAELANTPRTGWTELAWRWLDDRVAHRVLLAALSAAPDTRDQLAALEALPDLADADREVMLPRLARELAPELEAVLVHGLVHGDCLAEGELAPGGDEISEHDAPPSPERVRAALSLSERAMRLAPDDGDTQFTHAMLLLDADRLGMAGRLDELLAALVHYAAANQLHIAVRMSEQAHRRFAEVVEIVIGASFGSCADLDDELVVQFGQAVLARVPERFEALVSRLPARVDVLAPLASYAIQAGRREDALALYGRLLTLPVPRSGDERASYSRALNDACVQARAAQAYDVALRIADRAQPIAHENPYLFHSAACAYAAIGDYAKAFEQVKLAIEHDYDHLNKVEVDPDLGPLLEWPEFKALFRDWHARQEGN